MTEDDEVVESGATPEKPELPHMPADGEYLLYFSAPWCGPCKNFGPLLSRVCEAGGLTIIKISVDEHPDFCYQHGVRSVPTIKLIRDGNVLGTAIGAMQESQLREWLNGKYD